MTAIAPRPPKRRTETTLRADIRAAVNAISGCLVWVNSTGEYPSCIKCGDSRPRRNRGPCACGETKVRANRYGLAEGSADLIGTARGRFLSIEVKFASVPSEPQRNWTRIMSTCPGVIHIPEARSVDEVLARLREEGIE